MQLKKLSATGIRAFAEHLDDIRDGAEPKTARELFDEGEYTEALPQSIELEEREFENKRDLGNYLDELLGDLDQNWLGPEKGIWAAIAAYYLPQLCPRSADGTPNPGKSWYYIPSDDYRSDYRHKVRSPYYLTRRFGDDADAILTVSVETHGDVLEQLGSKLEVITNPVVIEVVDRLYFDEKKGSLKTGATDRNRPGNLRRYLTLLRQYERTYDLYSITPEELLVLLPTEFDGFRSGSGNGGRPGGDDNGGTKRRKRSLIPWTRR